MGYMEVKEESEEKLVLVRGPKWTTCAMAGGVVAAGCGAACYSEDSVLWMIAYITGAILLGLSCIEDWEQCEFDRKRGEIRQERQSVIDKIFYPIIQKQDVVVSSLEDLTNVSVEENELRIFGKGYKVILQFQEQLGISLGVTSSYVFGNSRDPEAIAEKIKKFVKIDEKFAKPVQREDNPSDICDDEESSTDEDFEKVDATQIEENDE